MTVHVSQSASNRPAEPNLRRLTCAEAMGAGPISKPFRHLLHYGLGEPPPGVWGCFDAKSKLTAMAVMAPQPGRTGLVFVTVPPSDRHIADHAALIDALVNDTDPAVVALAQALVDPNDVRHEAAFAAAGFETLATLCYLQMSGPKRAAEPDTPADVRFESYTPALRSTFEAALDATYEQTCDCPRLRGVRQTSDVLDGHMAAGRFEPALWTLMVVADEPAGVLLLNPVPEAQCLELVYIGIAAAHRGRGLGALLMRRAMWQWAQRRERFFTLAVDQTNTPAVRMYQRIGLKQADQRLAMMRRLPGKT